MTKELKWLGPYQIEEEIGRGGMAVVYRAIDTRSGREVALKVLPAYFAHDPMFLKRFLKEGQNAAGLNHPNIVKTYEAGESDGRHYIVLEIIHGQTLSEYLGEIDGPMAVEEAIEMLRQISVALNYAHQRGFVHRDIKPSNIMLSNDGRVLLTDFGIAKQMAMEETMMTETGRTIGTPAYMSPEQARGEKRLGPRSDIYSLGVLAYRMMTGTLPYEAESQWLVLNMILQGKPKPAHEANQYLPKGISYALMKALAKDPRYRFGTAIEFAKALQKGLSWSPSPQAYDGVLDRTMKEMHRPIPATAPSLPPERKSGSKWLPLVAVFILLMVSVGAAYVFLPWRDWMDANGHGQQAVAAEVDTATPTLTLMPTSTHTPTPQPTPTLMPELASLATPSTTPPTPITISQIILEPYEDVDGAFKLLVPTNWNSAQQGDDLIFTSADQFERIQLRHLSELPPEKTSQDILNDLLAEAESTFQKIETGERETVSLNGRPAVRQSVSAEFLGVQFFADLLAVRAGSDAFFMMMAAPKVSEDAYGPVFDTIAKSFSIDPTLVAAAGELDSTTAENQSSEKTLPTLAVAEKQATTSTPTPKPKTKSPPTKLPQPANASDPTLVLDFESEQRWIIGDQKYGYAVGTNEKAAAGNSSLKVGYENLPGVGVQGEHFIVLKRPRLASIPGKPTALQAKVFGNNDNTFLNLWIKDVKGEIWQFTFGEINYTGWRILTLPLDINGDWPVGVVQHRDNQQLDYPLTLMGLVVDNTQAKPITGVLYIDDLRTAKLNSETTLAKGATLTPSTLAPVTETPTADAPAAPEQPAGNISLTGNIAYSVWNAGQNDYLVQIRNADGSNPHTIYVGATQPDFCLQPTGRIIANGTRAGVEGTIVIEGEQSREVIPNTHDTLPACSPEGQRIVFESDREGGPHIWIHPDINVRDDAVAHRFALGEYPTWSSKWQIVWKGCDYWAGGGGKCGIWQAPDAWGVPVRLSTGGSDTAPDVSPDGGMVAFMSHETGKWQVFVVPATGGQPHQLTSKGDNGLPTWSPDGRGIAFVSNRG